MAVVKNVTFFALWTAIIVTGIILGNWQLDRLVWKKQLQAQIDAAYMQPVLPAAWPSIIPKDFFARGTLALTYDPATRVVVRPRRRGDVMGGDVYQVATMPPYGPRWVWRGFVRDGADIGVLPTRETVSVQIRAASISLPLLQMMRPDLPHQVPPLDAVIVIEADQEMTIATALTPIGTRPTLTNNHLFYAIFWLGMAAVALIGGLALGIQQVIKRG